MCACVHVNNSTLELRLIRLKNFFFVEIRIEKKVDKKFYKKFKCTYVLYQLAERDAIFKEIFSKPVR